MLVTIDPGNLPAWTGANITDRVVPTSVITESELRTYLTGRSDEWSGWDPVYTALSCLANNNTAPTVANAIPDQGATVATALSYTFPANTFSDADGHSLTYTATKSNGAALPSWLSFDASTRTFSGTPQSGDLGTVSVKVIANDGHVGMVTDTFDIRVGSSVVSISAPTDANEGNSGTTDKFFTISLSSTLSTVATVQICYTGTATRGATADYQSLVDSTIVNSACQNANIAAGATTTTLYGMRINGDTDAEPDETVIATLSLIASSPAGVVLGTATATYNILDDDTTAPGVTSIERHSPTDHFTNADSLTWRVTFSEAVRNVDATDFSLVIANTTVAFPGTTSLDVSSVSTSVYDITASGSGIENVLDNSIQLVFASGHNIEDLSGNALPASPTPTGTDDNSFTLDNTAPTVTSIERQSPTTAMTDEDSLTWRVTFDDTSGEAVVNVDATDFQVTGTTATITSVSEHATNIYDVTASGGDLDNLNGTVTLSIKTTHDITDDVGNALPASPTPTSGTNDNTFEVQNVVADPNAPKVVSIQRYEQPVKNLGTSLVWRVRFNKHLKSVRESDFTLTGATAAGLDVRHDLSNYDPETYKTIVFVYAQGGDLDTVSGAVTLNFASNHNIVDFEGRRLASTTPTSGTNQNSFTLNPNETLVYFTQENYYVDEGDEAVVTVKLSRLRDTATTISAISATPLTATGNGVDFHGQTYSVTIPAWRASGTVNIRTSEDTQTEDEERFRIDIHGFGLPAGVVVGNVPGGGSMDTQAYVHIRDEDTATAKANKEPGLVFDNAHLTWNEAAGCTNKTDGTGPGPSYSVKLKNRPAGPVEVWIKDPDDDNSRGQNAFVANGRLYVANSPGQETRTVLRFTPGNWDTYQLVNVKVRCADHYTAQIPIAHRMYTNYTGDKGKLSHAYPGYVGVVDKGWTVHVKVREANPPIVVRHLPAAGQPVDVKEGGHHDFEITLSEAAFKHDSTLTVYLSARGGKAAGVKRRDGDARSCGGPLDDCLIFTRSNRTQWVRLFAIGPGRDELKVEIPQLRWGNLEHARDWEMRWPVEVIQAQGMSTPSAAAPTQAVSGLQVTAIDAASAKVTWSAVEHARFYEVSWEAESSDQRTVVSGIESVAGASVTIQHNAEEDMTLTVTVTPEYVDGNGITRRMEALAATATLNIGPSAQSLGSGGTNGGGDGGEVDAGEGDAQASAQAACVSADLMQHVEARIEIAITDRWVRIKNALTGQPDAITLTEVKEIYENRKANGWDTNRLEEVIAAMECIENAMRQTPVPDETPDANPDSGPDSGPDAVPDPGPEPDPTPTPVTSAVTASATTALAENNLDGARVALTLDAGVFAATLAASDVTVSGLTGASVSSVTRDSDTQATATLAFDGTDFDANATLTLSVSANALTHSNTDLSATLPVTAVDEPPPPPPPPPPPATSASIPAPVAHWQFDGNADDAAGTRDGTASNGASFTTDAHIGSHALSLDGVDDYVDLTAHVSSLPRGNAARSITGWFRADAGNQGQTFFSYGPNETRKRFSIAADRTQAVVGVSGYSWGVKNLNLDDGWHHIAVIYAGGEAKEFSIYLNGVLQPSGLLGGFRRTLDTRTGPAAIGQSADGTKHYGGDIDDVRLYIVALSAEQVQAIANQKTGTEATAATPGGITPEPLAPTQPIPDTGDGFGTGQPGGWTPQPGAWTPNLPTGACVSPALLSDAAAQANETWRGPVHVERWLRVMQTFSGSASDATIVTPAEAQFYAAAGLNDWLPVAAALNCIETKTLQQAWPR